jgi:predicted acyl esterase
MKGIETGIMDEPTIRYQTTGMTTWQAGETWPLETTQWTDFYFQSLEQLGVEPDYWNEEPDAFVQQPLYVTEKRNRVTYVSPPLPYDLQVTGPPRITFYADIDQDDACWRVEVREADSDAIYPLASGWLKASHRALDDPRTTAWEIAHDHTKEVAIVPGEVNEYVVQLRPMSHLFRAGKQIKVEISCIDVPTDPETYDVMWHVCKSRTCTHKIYRDGRYPSKASLPVIPKKA